MNQNQKPYEVVRYFALALDPIHVGTGGYRLGRVDMSIVREPGTNLPKIPGTSLSGACRTYATMENPEKWPQCAGQGRSDKEKGTEGHCGSPNCPICVTFGFSKGEKSSFQGLAQFFDARLVFFPVHSLAGPVWVTCPSALADWGMTESEPADGETRLAAGLKIDSKLNLGWLMLDVVGNDFTLDGKIDGVPNDIKKRAVLVSNKLFSHIVNDNLEVRTSVSIDPATGAAAEGALYTYEALPRGSILGFEVVISDPRFYCINGKIPISGNKPCNKITNVQQTEKNPPDGRQQVKKTVETGLRLFEPLGVGGMGTRGMGRLRLLNLSTGGGK
ncbi:MAG: type III-B CRISPR module RAMP protein Cmr4 [Deltaproteobacteria bacterium]|nr:type III-B CRISPR module RAMP protein Cmr4 [Deltaproteobacteria bacterium]